MNEAFVPSSSSIQKKPTLPQPPSRQPKARARSSAKSSQTSKVQWQFQQASSDENMKKLTAPQRQYRRRPTTAGAKSAKRRAHDRLSTQQSIKRFKPNPVTSEWFPQYTVPSYHSAVLPPLCWCCPPHPVYCTPLRKSVQRNTKNPPFHTPYEYETPRPSIQPQVLHFSDSVLEQVQSYTPGWTPLPLEYATPPWRTEQIGILLTSSIMSDVPMNPTRLTNLRSRDTNPPKQRRP